MSRTVTRSGERNAGYNRVNQDALAPRSSELCFRFNRASLSDEERNCLSIESSFHCRVERNLLLPDESHLNAPDIAQKWPAGASIMKSGLKTPLFRFYEITFYIIARRE